MLEGRLAKAKAETGALGGFLRQVGLFGVGLELIGAISDVIAQARAESSITPIVVAVAKRFAASDLQLRDMATQILAHPLTSLFSSETAHAYYGLLLNTFILYVIVFGVQVPIIDRRVGIFNTIIRGFILGEGQQPTLNHWILVAVILAPLLWAYAYTNNLEYTPFSGVYTFVWKGLILNTKAFIPV